MSITVQCASCKNKYAAPASMLGRRVRCKRCGNVFAISGDALPNKNVADDGVLEGSLHGTASDVTYGGDYPPGSPNSEGNTAEVRSPFAADDIPASFEDAILNYVPASRPNTAYKFPTAPILDQWLPIVSMGAAALCLLILAFDGGPSIPGWVGPLRLLLFSGLYGLVVFPLCWWAVQLASRKGKFQLPPSPHWRIAAVFAFPFAFASLLWVNAGNLSGLITGAVTGLAIGSALLWFLLRLQSEEGPAALGYAAGGFAAGLVVSVCFLLLVNAIAMEIAKTMKEPTTLAGSPIVPGMQWVPPPTPAKPATPEGDEPSVAEPVAVRPVHSDVPAVEPKITQNPTNPTVSVAASEPAASPENHVTVARGSPDLFPNSTLFGDHPSSPATRSFRPAEPFSPPLPAPRAETPPPGDSVASTPPVPSATPDTGDAFLDGLRDAHSPLVASFSPVDISDSFSGLAPSLGGSPWTLMMSSEKLADQAWSDSINVWYMGVKPQRRFQRAAFRADFCRDYVLSPGGTWMVRLVKFPTLAVEVWANGEHVVAKMIPLPTDHADAKPTLLGFISEDRFLIRWQNASTVDSVGLEVWDIKTAKVQRPIILAPHLHTQSNWAVSPDGKMFAVVLKPSQDKGIDKARVAIYPLVGVATSEWLPITDMDPQWAINPAAIAFSPDNKRIAVMFEHENNDVIYNWRLSDRKLTGTQMVPAGVLPPPASDDPPVAGPNSTVGGPSPSAPHQLEWLSGGNSWLIHGNAVVDANDGRLIGELGAKGVVGEWVSGNTCLLLYRQNKSLRLVNLQVKSQSAATRQTTGQ